MNLTLFLCLRDALGAISGDEATLLRALPTLMAQEIPHARETRPYLMNLGAVDGLRRIIADLCTAARTDGSDPRFAEELEKARRFLQGQINTILRAQRLFVALGGGLRQDIRWHVHDGQYGRAFEIAVRAVPGDTLVKDLDSLIYLCCEEKDPE